LLNGIHGTKFATAFAFFKAATFFRAIQPSTHHRQAPDDVLATQQSN
jgi:hypothetical protein